MKNIIITILLSLCFSAMLQSQTPTITTLEYWLNGNFAQREQVPVTPASTLVYTDLIDADRLAVGLHTFHFRAMDENGKWCAANTQVFYKSPPLVAGGGLMVGVEYWVNAHFQNRVYVPQTPQNTVNFVGLIDLDTLASGLHTFNFRAKDIDGKWSLPHNRVFYKATSSFSGDNNITGYRYWFNGNIENYTLVELETPVNPYDMAVDINIPATLAMEENHLFYIQFKDEQGKWSMPKVDVFYLNEMLPTGIFIPKAEANNVVVYPNPFADKLNVLVKDAKNADIALYSAEGNLLVNYRNLSEVQIAASNLPAGVYIVKVTIDGKAETITIMKK